MIYYWKTSRHEIRFLSLYTMYLLFRLCERETFSLVYRHKSSRKYQSNFLLKSLHTGERDLCAFSWNRANGFSRKKLSISKIPFTKHFRRCSGFLFFFCFLSDIYSIRWSDLTWKLDSWRSPKSAGLSAAQFLASVGFCHGYSVHSRIPFIFQT